MNNLLSLDQASITTGYAIFSDKKLITFGHITCNKNNDLSKRLVYLRQELINLIKKYNINQIVFEDIQLQKDKNDNIKTFKVLAEVFGLVSELSEELNIPHQSISSNTWKSSYKIAGKGRSIEKKKSQETVNNLFNVSCTEDEADAICIGSHYLNIGIKQEEIFDWS